MLTFKKTCYYYDRSKNKENIACSSGEVPNNDFSTYDTVIHLVKPLSFKDIMCSESSKVQSKRTVAK